MCSVTGVSYSIDFIRIVSCIAPPERLAYGLLKFVEEREDKTMKMITLIIALSVTVTSNFATGRAVAEVQVHDMTGPTYEACAAIPIEAVPEADVESADYGVGLLFREYDLDGDGRSEFMTATQFDAQGPTGAIQAKPLFYWIDLNADATYDQVWIDQGGEGRCEDMVLYQGPVQGHALLPLYTELAPR